MTGNFFWSGLCLGIDRFKQLGNQDDNGTYVIDDREIVGHEKLYDGFAEQDQYDFDEILRTFDLDA